MKVGAGACLAVLAVFGAAVAAEARTGEAMEGNWETPTGSIVRVYPCGEDLCLKVTKVEKSSPVSTDVNNPSEELRKRPLCGMEIGQGFHVGPDQKADGGHLYDPKSGHTYRGSMQVDGDTLKLRGYIGVSLFGRSETWHRTGDAGTCH